MTDDRNDFDATDVNASDIRQERGQIRFSQRVLTAPHPQSDIIFYDSLCKLSRIFRRLGRIAGFLDSQWSSRKPVYWIETCALHGISVTILFIDAYRYLLKLKNNPAKFHPDPIWNDAYLRLFLERSPQQENKKNNSNKTNSDMRSVPDLKCL